MGFLSSSKKKSPDPFQSAVEQQRRRLRDRQSETAHQHNADHVRFGSTFPYEQPSFGFYSGENLAASRRRHREGPGRPIIGVDEGFKGVQNAPSPAPPQKDLSLPQDGWSPGPVLCERPGYVADGTRNLQYDPFDFTVPPFDVPPQEPCPISPISRSTPEIINHLPRGPMRHQLPTYDPGSFVDGHQPFGNPHPYTTPRFGRARSAASSPLWDAFRERMRPNNNNAYHGSTMSNRAPRSYERLRPPHLQRAGSRARGTGISSSILGEMW